MVNEKAVRQAIYEKLNVSAVTSKLAGGSAGLFHAAADQGAPFPFLVFNKQTGIPIRTLKGAQLNNTLWAVKAVVQTDVPGSPSAAEEIAKLADDELDGQSLNISGGTHRFLMREGDIDFAEIDGDTAYHHHGHLYRLIFS